MKAEPVSPQDLFKKAVQYRVPMFQRPYVWTEDDQWRPLWDDVVRLAERQLDGGGEIAPHFLGAIVLEQESAGISDVDAWSVIDGQQRLTTLQLLLDAAQTVVAEHGTRSDNKKLQTAILNDEEYAEDDPDLVFKVWPTSRDQEAFRTAMGDGTTVPPALLGAPIVKAHTFFTDAARAWIEQDERREERATALRTALLQGLRVVAIFLDPDDNAQVIFESLNYRGSPLLAADLIKNFVFQEARRQKVHLASLYEKTWAELDADFWREEVRQGRLARPRIDVFLTHWLVSRLGREVASDRIYTEFRDNAAALAPDITTVAVELAADAALYRSLDSLPASSVPGQFVYRVLTVMDQTTFTPAVLWLMRPGATTVEQRDRALRALESYVVRRGLLKLATGSYNQLVAELLRALPG